MTNNELDNLVESFLSPKPTPKAMELKELFALFEELEKSKQLLSEVEQQFTKFVPSELDVSAPETVKKFNELIKNNKVENLDRQEFDKLLRQQLDSVVGDESDPLTRFGIFIRYLNSLKRNEIQETDLGKVFAAIVFATSILSMIREFYSAPSAAGFLYERFIAYFFHGIMPEGTPIEDVVVNNEKWSLKLKSDTDISGSIDGMINFFNQNPNTVVKYLISQKSKDLSSIVSWVVAMNQQQFNELLVKKGQKEKYEKIKDLEKSLKKGETQTSRQQLDMSKKELESRLVYQNSSDLQFSFTLNDMKAYTITDQPLELSLTAEDVTNIMANNSDIFNNKISQILKEVNTVADKVNNYLLTGRKDVGNDALETVESLGVTLNDIVHGSE